MLGYCVTDKKKHIFRTSQPLLDKIENACCSHGYMIHKSYAPKLIQNMQKGAAQLLTNNEPSKYALDIYWKRLQVKDMWLCYRGGPIGLQREGYSDIEARHKGRSITDIATGK